MKYEEKHMDLFDVDESYFLAHCISADYNLGAGIAVEFNKHFNLTPTLIYINRNKYPDCIPIKRVFNLVTKQNYWDMPTYKDLERALKIMKGLAVRHNVNKIAMPRIGCGLDHLVWENVKYIVKEVFDETDIEILICIK